MRFTTIAKRSIEAGLSLSALSERLGMHRSYVSRMKQNRAVAEPSIARTALRLIREHSNLAQPSGEPVVDKGTESVVKGVEPANRFDGSVEPRVCLVLSSGAWDKVSGLLETLDPGITCYRLVEVAR